MNQDLRPAVNETDIMINSYSGKAIEFLLERGSLPVLYWLKRDILDVPYEREIRNLKKYAARVRILESQGPDGSWCDKLIENSPAAARARAAAGEFSMSLSHQLPSGPWLSKILTRAAYFLRFLISRS